jgi:hypothetical protein
MLKFGIVTEAHYLSLGEKRKFSAAHVAYNLLNVGPDPTQEQIRVFEDISITLRTSNGTFRTTFGKRFEDVDAVALRWIKKLYPQLAHLSAQDRAVSHGLTSKEFAELLFQNFAEVDFEASDVLLGLIELSIEETGEVFVTEQNGTPLQYIKAPFVVALHHREPMRYPVNRWVASRARRRFRSLNLPEGWTKTAGGSGYKVRPISYIHPEVRKLADHNPHFQFRMRSVFDRTPAACHVLRTMNIFNRAYFSEQQMADGAAAVHESLQPGGLWIVGRTLEEDLSNHATFLQRKQSGWEVLERIGKGSEMEPVALGAVKV